MKTCSQCQTQLPPDAAHCGACGARQPAGPPAAQPARTMMGYPGMAEELIETTKRPRPGVSGAPQPGFGPPPSAAQPTLAETAKPYGAGGSGPFGGPPPAAPPHGFGPPPAAASYSPPAAPPLMPTPVSPVGPTPMAAPPFAPPPGAAGHGGPPAASYSPPAAASFPPPPTATPPAGAPFAGGPFAPPPGAGFGSAPAGASYGTPPAAPAAPAPGRWGDSSPSPFANAAAIASAASAPATAPGAAPLPYGGMANVPVRAAAGVAPHLRGGFPSSPDAAWWPVEPWADALRTILLIFGAVLIACFVAPWAIGEGATTFSWKLLTAEGATFSARLVPIAIAATGLVGLIAGFLAIGAGARGVLAALLGLAPPLAMIVVVAPEFRWQELAGLVGALLAATALVIRARYRAATLPRILVTIGVLAALAPHLIPDQGLALWDAVTGLGASKLAAPHVLLVAKAAVLALGLLAWLPPHRTGGAVALAWILLLWAPIEVWTNALFAEVGLAGLKANLFPMIHLPLAVVAWSAMAAYGIASVAGKSLERG